MRPPIEGTVLITGASSGIGADLARVAAERASRLVLVARRADRLHALADELRARRATLDVIVLPCDLTDTDALNALITFVQPLPVDVLVNNAGLGHLGLFEDMPVGRSEELIALNVTALTTLTRALVPGMIRRGSGGVLNISSGWGLVWSPSAAVYAGTKHYVNAFSEALRLEVAPAGVVVTQVCPGPVRTEFASHAGSPGDMPVPEWLLLPSERCAAEAWAAFVTNRALVVPGRLAGVVIHLSRGVPAWLLRLAQAPFARWLRDPRRRPTA